MEAINVIVFRNEYNSSREGLQGRESIREDPSLVWLNFIYFLHKFRGLGKITLRHGCNTVARVVKVKSFGEVNRHCQSAEWRGGLVEILGYIIYKREEDGNGRVVGAKPMLGG